MAHTETRRFLCISLRKKKQCRTYCSEAQVALMDAGELHFNLCDKEISSRFMSSCNSRILKLDIDVIAQIKLCTKQKNLRQGRQLHAHILQRGLLETNKFVGNTLVNMYAKCGALAHAQEVFDKLPVHDVVSWTALVSGYAEHGHGKKAIQCFEQMQEEGLTPDAVTFGCTLKACGSIRDFVKGKELHAAIAASGFLKSSIVLGNSLIDMYAKCGALAKAQQALQELPSRNVISWTTLITGYCQLGHGETAIFCFERMMQEGISPTSMTLACILKACGSTQQAEKGELIYAEILRNGLLENDCVLGNAVVDMYAKCGDLVKAYEVFADLHARDMFSWNALVTDYVNHGQAEEALACFEQMKHEKFSPDAVTFVCALKACASIGAAEKGSELHNEIIRKQLQGKGIVLGNALVDMYAKCGSLLMAQRVFNDLPMRDIVSWTALISGFSEHGYAEKALQFFEQMKYEEGLAPNAITFSCILKACSSIGAMEKGRSYFESMTKKYGISPTSEHQTCMVALYGHTGHFEKAMDIIKEMQTSECLPAWSALMGASCKWGDIKSGKIAFEHAMQLDERSSLAYVQMSNIFAFTARQQFQ